MKNCSHNKLQSGMACPICKIPLLHTWDGGLTFNSGGFNFDDAEWICEMSGEVSGSAIETGAGLSTLIFLFSNKPVRSYISDLGLIDRINQYLEDNGSEFPWTPVLGLSGDKLPEEQENYGIGLIDGGHGFPVPQVDFYFINRQLKKGGLLIIDDAQLPAPREIIFNLVETEWLYRLKSISPSGKSYCFSKLTDDIHFPDFGGLNRDLRLSFSNSTLNQDLEELRNTFTDRLQQTIP